MSLRVEFPALGDIFDSLDYAGGVELVEVLQGLSKDRPISSQEHRSQGTYNTRLAQSRFVVCAERETIFTSG